MSYTSYNWRMHLSADPSDKPDHKNAMIEIMAKLHGLETEMQMKYPFLNFEIETWW